MTEKVLRLGTLKCQGVNHRCFLPRATAAAAKLQPPRLPGREGLRRDGLGTLERGHQPNLHLRDDGLSTSNHQALLGDRQPMCVPPNKLVCQLKFIYAGFHQHLPNSGHLMKEAGQQQRSASKAHLSCSCCTFLIISWCVNGREMLRY